MFKELFSQRVFVCALVIFTLLLATGVVYLNHVKTQTSRDIANTEAGKASQQRTEPGTAPLTEPVPKSDTSEGGHRHADGPWHTAPHTPPQSPQVQRQPATKSERLAQTPQTGTAPNPAPSASTQGQHLTPEQIVVYTTLINAYEKEALEFQRLRQITRTELAELKAESEAYREKAEAWQNATLTARADYDAGRITWEEYNNRDIVLRKIYREVLPQEYERIRERDQALEEKLNSIIEDHRAHQARAPEVERARRLLQAHINAD